MIIDTTDFEVRPNRIPNQEESRDFVSFLETEEDRIAIELLGYPLWKEFQEALQGSGSLDQKWIDLRDGAEYTYNNKTYHYKGWVDMIRPAIMVAWVPLTTHKLTNIGFVENNAPQQSKLLEDDYAILVNYWNTFVKSVIGSKHISAYNCGISHENSFYGFMKANSSNYTDWCFTAPHYKNRHDI